VDIHENNDVSLAIYGFVSDGGKVRAGMFLRELRSFLTALQIADWTANRSEQHDYFVEDLRKSSDIVQLRETRTRQRKRHHVDRPASAVRAFHRMVTSVYNSERDAAELPEDFIKTLHRVTRYAGLTFEHAEIHFDTDIIRIDDYLNRKVERLLHKEDNEPDKPPVKRNFAGISYASVDGSLQVADLRGDLVRGTFTLSAGGKEIDCVIRKDNLSSIRATLGLRVRADVIAHYDGESLLPIRLEIKTLKLVKADADLGKWQGAFDRTSTDSSDRPQ